MNTARTALKTVPPITPFRLPEPPPREYDEVTSYDHLHKIGSAPYLIAHLGNPETTLVVAERWIVAQPDDHRSRARIPDLLIAFDVDPALYTANNGYIISEQGKPPDFVLEVASPSTAEIDTGEKRIEYARLGIQEYWRFDHTGRYHGTRLAGDRLENGVYQSIPIDELAADLLQGYSAALNLYLRWEQGELGWHNPATGRHIVTLQDAQQDQLQAEAHAAHERAARAQAEAHAAHERAARAQAEAHAEQATNRAEQAEANAEQATNRAEQAEARSRALEAELRRLRRSLT